MRAVPASLAGSRHNGDASSEVVVDAGGRRGPRSEERRFTEMCAARGFPCTRIGVVVGDELEVQGQFSVPLGELRAAWDATLPALFG